MLQAGARMNPSDFDAGHGSRRAARAALDLQGAAEADENLGRADILEGHSREVAR